MELIEREGGGGQLGVSGRADRGLAGGKGQG